MGLRWNIVWRVKDWNALYSGASDFVLYMYFMYGSRCDGWMDDDGRVVTLLGMPVLSCPGQILIDATLCFCKIIVGVCRLFPR